jgi:large subunit ribosomal protein L7/L12
MKLKDVIRIAKYIAPHAAPQFEGSKTLRELEIVARFVGANLDSPKKGMPVEPLFDVSLRNAGSNKIGVIKAVRELTSLGLKEAKDLCDDADARGAQVVLRDVVLDQANRAAVKLREAGADVSVA